MPKIRLILRDGANHVSIRITVHSSTHVTVTETPSWLGRILGRVETVRDARRARILHGTYAWLYADNGEVSGSVADAITRALNRRAGEEQVQR